jgi:hypothetical protein
MVPKRQSQTACGISHSAADHQLLTPSCKFAVRIPVRFSIELEEGPEEEFFFWWRQVSKEGVIVKPAACAEVLPAAPDAVGRLVSGFLLRVKDDSTVCRTCETQHKISLGSGEMLKLGGIWDGRKV